jgi:hypothetical protein
MLSSAWIVPSAAECAGSCKVQVYLRPMPGLISTRRALTHESPSQHAPVSRFRQERSIGTSLACCRYRRIDGPALLALNEHDPGGFHGIPLFLAVTLKWNKSSSSWLWV